MRLWSLHPKLLDPQGLVALWREGLLAQKVLAGKTRGYRHHPQLERFKATRDPLRAIGSYLWSVAEEAKNRGYRFDKSKVMIRSRRSSTIEVTRGQLKFELQHLLLKLRRRSPEYASRIKSGTRAPIHPLFKAVPGKVESWEKLSN